MKASGCPRKRVNPNQAERAETAERKRIAVRIAVARRLWEESEPVAGTLAECYLTNTRGIPVPDGGWPDCIRFHPGTRSVIFAATTPDGALQAVQRVRLTAEGTKAPGTAEHPDKTTNGVLAGATVRLPGDSTGPLLLCEGPETGLSVRSATAHETWIALGSTAKLMPPAGRIVVVCRDDDAPDAGSSTSLDAKIVDWRASGLDIREAWPWPERRGHQLNFKKTDFNDTLKVSGVEAVRAQISAAIALPSKAAAPTPHYPRPHLSGQAASRRLRRAMAAFVDRAELCWQARDWIDLEAARIEPAVRQETEQRIRAKLIGRGLDPAEAERDAAVRAQKAASRMAKRAARVAAAKRFGKRAAAGHLPRFQIKGAAGLGKTQAFIEEYVRRPALWSRNIAVFCRDLNLCDAFAADVRKAAAGIQPASDGTRPRPVVIRGRQSEGMCHPDRLIIVNSAISAGCDSIYQSCCHTPAIGGAPESFCPRWATCSVAGYIGQFGDQKPALRILPHARLSIRQPVELRMPTPDLVIVDESCISALTTNPPQLRR